MASRVSVRTSAVDLAVVESQVARDLADHSPWLRATGIQRVTLGLHEHLVNVHKHAYAGAGGPVDIEIDAGADAVTIRTSDRGIDFADATRRDPLHVSEYGGYGLMITRAVFDTVEHLRDADQNVWVLRISHPRGATT